MPNRAISRLIPPKSGRVGTRCPARARHPPVVTREGKNLRGRFLEVVLGTIGKSVLVKAFHHTVKAIEARAKSHKEAA